MLLRQDELNDLKGNLAQYKGDLKGITGLLSDWLFLAYADGKTDVEDQLGRHIEIPIERVMDTVSADVGGKNAFQRVKEYFYLEDYEAILEVFKNERKRVYNVSAFNTATELGAAQKEWHCMNLPESRDTHIYLDGTIKNMDEEFCTYNGDTALYPMGFEVPEEDINCLCYLTFT